jgi:hypothetical protein
VKPWVSTWGSRKCLRNAHTPKRQDLSTRKDPRVQYISACMQVGLLLTQGPQVSVSSSAVEKMFSPPHRPREDGFAHPTGTSRSNLADALGVHPGATKPLGFDFRLREG